MWNMWVHVRTTMHNANSIQRRKKWNGERVWWCALMILVTWGIFKNIYDCTRAPPCKWSFQTNLSPHTRRREVRWQMVMCNNITTMTDWCGGAPIPNVWRWPLPPVNIRPSFYTTTYKQTQARCIYHTKTNTEPSCAFSASKWPSLTPTTSKHQHRIHHGHQWMVSMKPHQLCGCMYVTVQ